MNSWKSRSLGACTPPLSTLKCGTGSDGGNALRGEPPPERQCADVASARASAIEMPTVALAPSLLLFGGAVQVDHRLVRLGQRVPGAAAEQVGDLAVDVRDGRQDAPALVPGLVAVAELHRLPRPGGRARGHPGPGRGAVGQRHGHGQRRPSPRVKDLQRGQAGHRERRHGPYLPSGSASGGRPFVPLLFQLFIVSFRSAAGQGQKTLRTAISPGCWS